MRSFFTRRRKSSTTTKARTEASASVPSREIAMDDGRRVFARPVVLEKSSRIG
jgi:hypothetical protein